MSDKQHEQPIVQPLVEEIKERQKPKEPSAQPPKEGPLKPSELDQDSGGGYNVDHTIPQS
jgi:hypothetical protein